MNRFLCCLCVVAAAVSAAAQDFDRIRYNPDMVWAQGAGRSTSAADKVALLGLCHEIAGIAGFTLPENRREAVMETYIPDLKRLSRMVASDGVVLRYIPRDEVPLIFEGRRKRAAEFEAAGWLEWAWYCRASLPGDHSAQLRELEGKVKAGKEPPRRLDYIRREIDAVKAALGRSPGSARPAADASPKQETAAAVNDAAPAVRDTLAPVPSMAQAVRAEAAESAPSTIPERPGRVQPAPAGKAIRWGAGVEFGIMPELCPGFSAFVTGGRFGGYVSVLTNLTCGSSDISCISTDTEALYLIWPVSVENRSYWQVSAGGTMAIGGRWDVLAGAGYGRRQVIWMTSTGQRALVSDLSAAGVLLEAGGRYRLPRPGGLCLHAVATTLAFRTAGIRIGASYMF